MKRALISALVTTFLISIAGAATTAKPPQLDQSVLIAKTVLGEKTTLFTVKDQTGKYELMFVSNSGDTRTKSLRQKDVDSLKAEFAKLPIAPKIPNECSRAYMTISLIKNGKAVETKESCFGLSTKTEPAYVRFSKILVGSL